jgi:uncharacterized membrane protein YphA (DoxX/SURF4 family)
MANPTPRLRSTTRSSPMNFLEKLKPLAQIVLRWGLAIVFAYHGFPKLFTHRAQYLTVFPKLGFPAYFVYISGFLEVAGSGLLVVGLFTRPIALLLTGEMAIVIWRVSLAKGGVFAVANYQLELALGISIDRLLFGSKS